MWRNAPAQNRFVDERDHQRLYKQHLKALASAKPSVETHQEPLRKFQRSRRKRKPLWIFDGSKLQTEAPPEKLTRDVDVLSARSEPVPDGFRLPIADIAHTETQITRRVQSARAAPPRKPLRDRNALTRGEERPDVIRKRPIRTDLETVSEIYTPEPYTPVSFGADMWDTSDETDDDNRDCFELEEDTDF
jgi:hypothetical protein